MDKILLRGGGTLCLWLVLVSVTHGYEGWSSGARRSQWIEINGHILAANSPSQTAHLKSSRSSTPHYLLLTRRGGLVIQGFTEQPVLPYHRLWLKGEDAMFNKLLAEEQLFIEVRISGLLREYQPDTGILELGHIEVVPARSHKSGVFSAQNQ